MKLLSRLLGFCFLCACTSTPKIEIPEPVVYVPRPMPVKQTLDFQALKRELGLVRDTRALGFDERSYDSCRMSLPGDQNDCGSRFLSVVNFRLLCRDTVGTTSRVPTSLTPLRSRMQWRLNGSRGFIRTDEEGYGQVEVASRRSAKLQRFMLVIGKKSLGVEAGEVSKIIVPGDWCKKWKS